MAELKELGTLVVVVGKARNLPNKSRFGKQDPFCTVSIADEKQRTKAIKRGGQHPEWDEELRFTINEDVDDLLVRSESQNQFDSLPSSLSSKHASLSSHANPSHPTPPAKDMTPTASLNSSLSGSVTAQALANKSRKGPINKKGGKALRVACFADDAKEPELIGEVTVPIDDVLKQGEVDEWYEFSFKDKYSGEVYLELTFYSNNAPPVKRNVPRPSTHQYDTGSSSSTSLSGRPGGLVASGSVSGMNLYIPPYVQAGRISPGPPPGSGGFADLGLPPGHRQSLSAVPPGSALDALTRPMSSLSIASNAPSHPFPPQHMPPQQQMPPLSGRSYGGHRHSLSGGGVDPPWSHDLPQNQINHNTGALRPLSAAETMQHISQAPIRDPRRTPQPQVMPGVPEHRTSVPLPIPSSLLPGQAPQGYGEPRPHAHSFSGPSRPVVPPQHQPASSYLHPSPAPTPPHHSNSAPPNTVPQAQNQPHYQMPASSYGAGGQQPPYDPRSASPYPQDPSQRQGGLPQPPSRSNSVPVQQPSPQPYLPPQGQGYYQDQDQDRSYTPRPNYTPQPQQTPPHTSYPPGGGHSSRHSYSGPPPMPPPSQTPPYSGGYDARNQSPYSQAPASQGYQPPSSQPPREPTPNSQGYIPWYQQTQSSAPAPAPSSAPPAPAQQSYQQQGYQTSQPPPIPGARPLSAAPGPPAPPSRPSVGYYPSDELYVQQPPPSEPPKSHTPQASVAPWQQNQRPVSPQPPIPGSWQQPSLSHTQGPGQSQAQGSYGYQAPSQGYENRYASPAPPPPPRAPSPAYQAPPQSYPSHPPPQQNYQASDGYQQQQQQSSYGEAMSTSPQPYPPPNHTPSPYQNINTGSSSSPPRAPAGWQSTLPPRAPSPNPPQAQANGWNHNHNHNHNPAPVQPARAPSPLPTQIGQDWRSYMQSLNTPGNPQPQSQSQDGHGQGRAPSPAPPPPPGQGQGGYYAPPPNLPSSLRPPEGWQSTLPTSNDGRHQWQR